MTAHIEVAADRVRVELAGELDLAAQQTLRDTLDLALSRATHAVEIDLDQVRLLDCCALGAILTTYRAARQRDVVLTVRNPRGLTRRVMEITGTLALLAVSRQDPASRRPTWPEGS